MPETGTFTHAKTEGKGNVYEGEFRDGIFDGQGANLLEPLVERFQVSWGCFWGKLLEHLCIS